MLQCGQDVVFKFCPIYTVCLLVSHRDARNMARDVLNALTAILKSQGSMDDAQAASFIKKLQSENRFLQDVWS